MPTPAPTSAARFVPGAVLAGRYRLVAMLGRGGMGEVYRADDLTLDQPVALKFLPEGVAHDGARLAQFHNELRIARQVSHKNVCRLYDLGEADGRQFITMEYVDGEDLASLIRRIGRLPHDKAVEIARQLCAGVAAAHERGVLHRDLKPANVMLDGDGNVRITDFGLAIADSSSAGADHAGTPQYMAPEQLKGQPASVKSDIYALGLILFEIFTGKRAYDAKTLQDLQNLHESRTITTPSSVVRDMDPAVERVILRCLEPDPSKRPASAIGVAAALPGGDPLAAALAAGETPSPEMVAAAGVTGALRPAIGIALMLFVLAGLLVIAGVGDKQLLVARLPLDKSIDALADRAKDVAVDLGYTAKPADTAQGLQSRGDYMSYLEKTMPEATRWSSLATADGPTIQFWYRSSPRLMVPISRLGHSDAAGSARHHHRHDLDLSRSARAAERIPRRAAADRHGHGSAAADRLEPRVRRRGARDESVQAGGAAVAAAALRRPARRVDRTAPRSAADDGSRGSRFVSRPRHVFLDYRTVDAAHTDGRGAAHDAGARAGRRHLVDGPLAARDDRRARAPQPESRPRRPERRRALRGVRAGDLVLCVADRGPPRAGRQCRHQRLLQPRLRRRSSTPACCGWSTSRSSRTSGNIRRKS